MLQKYYPSHRSYRQKLAVNGIVYCIFERGECCKDIILVTVRTVSAEISCEKYIYEGVRAEVLTNE
jgi:hypothetical protein